jgi:hypothetical protein
VSQASPLVPLLALSDFAVTVARTVLVTRTVTVAAGFGPAVTVAEAVTVASAVTVAAGCALAVGSLPLPAAPMPRPMNHDTTMAGIVPQL